MKYLRGVFDLCTGCEACLLACSNRAAGGYSPRAARMKVLKEKENIINRPLVCTQCENPFCLHSCPVEAIAKDEKSGVVLIDKEKCTSCGNCLAACPDKMILWDQNGKADKCDLCEGNPLCVQYCVPGALGITEKVEVTGG